ncbi:MAG: c-type cytochrome [Pseudomonadota bacterium]
MPFFKPSRSSTRLLLRAGRALVHALFALALSCLLLLGAWSAGAQTVAPADSPGRQWVTPPPGSVLRGQALYAAQCSACHAVDENRVGPAHRGVMGRRVGSLPGYTYSAELAQSRLRWTPQTLERWLEDPEELVAGQRMGFQVEDAQARADLIAYLATLK